MSRCPDDVEERGLDCVPSRLLLPVEFTGQEVYVGRGGASAQCAVRRSASRRRPETARSYYEMNHPLPWRASHAVHATRDVGLHLLVEGGSLLAIKF